MIKDFVLYWKGVHCNFENPDIEYLIKNLDDHRLEIEGDDFILYSKEGTLRIEGNLFKPCENLVYKEITNEYLKPKSQYLQFRVKRMKKYIYLKAEKLMNCL